MFVGIGRSAELLRKPDLLLFENELFVRKTNQLCHSNVSSNDCFPG